MGSQARKLSNSQDALQPFIVVFASGKIMAVKAHTWTWSVGGDQILFQKPSGKSSFFRSSKIDCVIHVSDLDELPSFIKMQDEFQRVLERLEAIEKAIS